MRWSELRSRVEAEFAEELRGRVSVHVTRHHHRSRSGRGWITIDGKEIANFCDWSVYYPNPDHRASHKDALAAYGELRAWDFKEACWALVHEGIEPALASGDPLRQGLAVLHRKFGRRRLKALLSQRESLHPLVRFLAEFRKAPNAGAGQATESRSPARPTSFPTTSFDAAEFLGSETRLVAFLEDALASGDPVVLQNALATAVRAQGVAQVAKEAGLGRESLYKALRPEATPQFWTIVRVLNALGVGLRLERLPSSNHAATGDSRDAHEGGEGPC